MSVYKRFLILGLVFITASAMVMGQSNRTSTSGQDMTVEQSYLQESIELMIIREQSRAESRDMKLVALEYIRDAIDRGNTSDDIRASLEYLGLEGVVNVTRENGRIVNNFPDVRKQAATYLGQLGTPEAKNSLKRMVNADNEPMVIAEAIRSLGVIGLNDNNEVSSVISWNVRRFHTLNPDNYLASLALDAYERIADVNGGLKDPDAFRTIQLIADGPYITPVRNRAIALFGQLRQHESN